MPMQKKPQDQRSRKNCADQAVETKKVSVLAGIHTLERRRGSAMERLKSAYLLAILALAAVPSVGQQTAPHAPNAGAVAVVGDIEHCNTYPVPTDTALTVRQAVINAGLLSESVNVTVIRSAHDRAQWTQLVSANSADNGEPVENGDILVVQSMSPLTDAVRKNAALRTDSGVVVIGLEQDGIVIGDVLKATDYVPQNDGQLKVICRFPGKTPIAKAELYHPVAHGDVISVSRSNRRVLKGFGSMAPAVSEWKNSGATAARDPFIPIAVPANSNSFTSSELTSGSIQGQGPLSQDPSMFLAIPNADLSEADVAEDLKNAEPPTTLVPTLPISQSEDIADVGMTDDRMSFASASTTVAPNAPLEAQLGPVASSTASAFNPWNLVFIGGLLLAGTLILAGTLKPEPDDNSKFSTAASVTPISNATRCSPTAAPPTKFSELRQQLGIGTPILHPAAKTTAIEPAIQMAVPVQTSKPLIAEHEWFSGDCHGPVVSSTRESQVESSIADQAPASLLADTLDAAIESHTNIIAAEPPVQETTSPAVTTAEHPAVISGSVRSGKKHQETMFEVKAVNTVEEDEQSFSDLEDLLQNRLPIDLCETQLPLRVGLFGKPAGPRRLRIDAAHSAVPAPHMNLSPEKRREQPVATTSAASAHAPTAAGSSGGLDRALHFLQERTES